MNPTTPATPGPAPSVLDEVALEREALRLFHRYTVEIVEGLGFCPWAEPARLRGQVSTRVELAAAPSVESGAAWVRQLSAMPGIEIGFLVHPRFAAGRQAFEQQVRLIRDAYSKDPGPQGVTLAVVAFHPDAKAELHSPLAFVNYVRRSPDPTIQAIRLSTLEGLRKQDGRGTQYLPPGADLSKLDLNPPGKALHERVAETNLDTAQRLGIEHIAALVDDIHADRRRSYARLGLDS